MNTVLKFATFFVNATVLPYEHKIDRSNHYNKTPRNINQNLLDNILVSKLIDIQGYEIWKVNGNVIRDLVDVDFVEGGNPARYRYVPSNQIWVEDNLSREDTIATAVHEIIEMELMKEGLSYGKAHDQAAEIEKQLRNILPDG